MHGQHSNEITKLINEYKEKEFQEMSAMEPVTADYILGLIRYEAHIHRPTSGAM